MSVRGPVLFPQLSVKVGWVRPFAFDIYHELHCIALAAPLLAVDAKSEGVDTKSEQNTTKMGKRRQLVPIAGQSGLRFGGGRAELPLEDVLEAGDRFFGNIFSGAESGVWGS